MNRPSKVSEILDSLHEHIEEQKRFLDDENKKLLESGKLNFQKALAREQIGRLQNKNRSFGVKDKKLNLLKIKQALKGFISYIMKATGVVYGFFQNLSLKLRRFIEYLINVKRKH